MLAADLAFILELAAIGLIAWMIYSFTRPIFAGPDRILIRSYFLLSLMAIVLSSLILIADVSETMMPRRVDPIGSELIAVFIALLSGAAILSTARTPSGPPRLPKLWIAVPAGLFLTVLSLPAHYLAKTSPCCENPYAAYFGFPFSWLGGILGFGANNSLRDFIDLSLPQLIAIPAKTNSWFFLFFPFTVDLLLWVLVAVLLLGILPWLFRQVWQTFPTWETWKKAAAILGVLFLAFFSWWQPVGLPLIYTDPDYQAILTSLQAQYQVFNAATCHLDGSHLSEVYANDIRGGLLPESDFRLIRAFYPQKAVSPLFTGLLDAQSAYITWYTAARPKYEALNSGPSADSRSVSSSAMQAMFPLEATYNLSAAQERGCGKDHQLPTAGISIYKAFDIAHVTTKIPGIDQGKIQFTLVKRAGIWFTVGIYIHLPPHYGKG